MYMCMCACVRVCMYECTHTLLDPVLNLPMFYAVNQDNLPQVGVEHIDVSALLREV